jgi:hypothetical protein
MKKLFSTLSLTISIMALFNFSGYSQTTGIIGKLYTKAAADQTYGKVNSSVTVNTLTITQVIERSPDHLMFNIINGNLIILNGKRAVLYSSDFSTKSVSRSAVFHYFSASKIKELIQLGGNNPFTTIELRSNNILTISSGTETLEAALLCPPVCP